MAKWLTRYAKDGDKLQWSPDQTAIVPAQPVRGISVGTTTANVQSIYNQISAFNKEQGPVNGVKQFYKDYIKSPEFKRKALLSRTPEEARDYIESSYKNVSHTTVGYRPGERNVNNSYKEPFHFLGYPNINLDSTQDFKTLKYDQMNKETLQQSILPHEMSHSYDEYLSDPEVKVLQKNNKKSGNLHDDLPTELHADLNLLRYKMQKAGIYNVGERKMTPDDLQKAKKVKDIKDDPAIKRLNWHLNDKKIINLNNTITYNSDNSKSTTAKYGGWLSKY